MFTTRAQLIVLTVCFGFGTCLHPDCGKSSKRLPITSDPIPVVINGNESKNGNWPWMVSLQDLNGNHFCGGSLIREDIVLTAAHCIKNGNDTDKKTDEIVIVMGDVDLTSPNVTKRRGARIVLHHKWDRYDITKGYDVAVILLKEAVKFNGYIRPICLGRDDASGQLAFIAGWGDTHRHLNSGSKTLREAVVTIRNQCNKTPDEQHCTGSSGHGVTICKGDSGGPLMVQKPNGTWAMAGINSYVYGNCLGEAYYARVSFHRQWIKRQIVGLKVSKTRGSNKDKRNLKNYVSVRSFMDKEIGDIESAHGSKKNLTDFIKSHLNAKYGRFRWVVCAATSPSRLESHSQMSAEDFSYWNTTAGKDIVVFRLKRPKLERKKAAKSAQSARRMRIAFQDAQKDVPTGGSLQVTKLATKKCPSLATKRLFVTNAGDVQCSSDESVDVFKERIGKYSVVAVEKWQ